MVVVVGSILIAFALDAWWDRRAERRIEIAHVRAIRSDFAQNVARLTQRIDQEDRISSASRQLLVIAVSDGPPVAEDSISTLWLQVFNSGRFDPVMGAYQAVLSSGGLAQLRDDSLRLALAEFASLLEGRYAERFADQLYFDFVRSYMGRLGLSAVVAAGDSDEAATAVDQPQLELLRDPRFQEHLAMRYAAERDVARSYRELLAKAERIVALISE